VFRDIYKAYLPRDYAVEDYYTQAESLRADKGRQEELRVKYSQDFLDYIRTALKTLTTALRMWCSRGRP
jgi:hypothetical protein